MKHDDEAQCMKILKKKSHFSFKILRFSKLFLPFGNIFRTLKLFLYNKLLSKLKQL